MTSSPRRSRRTVTRAAIALVITAGSTAALTGTATAHGTAGTVTAAPLVKGLYQSSYSERNKVLWTTSAVGRPPVVSSSLLKVDPKTLKVKQTVTPPVTDAATGALEAVYGVAVDDEHDTVWTTNTRNNTVAVYSQRTGKHLATLPNVAHAREIVVDERHDTVWTTAFGDGSLVAFDSKTFEEKRRVTVDGAAPPVWSSTSGPAPPTRRTSTVTRSSRSPRSPSPRASSPPVTARSRSHSPGTAGPPTPPTRPVAASR